MPKALVFSGESFLGGCLCRTLQEDGYAVVSTAWKPAEGAAHLGCDLMDARRVDEIVSTARPDCVFQCAGVTWTQEPRPLYATHVLGTINVLEAVAQHNPAAPVVLVGSAAEYGDIPADKLPVREGYPALPPSFFGASKLAQTGVARSAAAEWKLSVAVARPFNILGPGLPVHYFAAALAQRLLRARAAGEKGDVPVTNAEATRDFVDVRDVAAALKDIAVKAPPRPGTLEIYNIASGKETTILAVAEKLCSLAGGFRAVAAGATTSRSGISRSWADVGKLQHATGWTASVDWQRSIEDMWAALTRE
jgi:GDP-4-dehydro-6-deoxy-D-mannose reductase